MPTIPHSSSAFFFTPGQMNGSSTNSSTSSAAGKKQQQHEPDNYNFSEHRYRMFGNISPLKFVEDHIGNRSNHQKKTQFFANFRRYPFTFNEKKEIAKKHPALVSQHIHQFYFEDSDQKIEFLSYLFRSLSAGRRRVSVSELCQKMDIKEQGELIQIGDAIVNTIAIFDFNEDIYIDDPKKRYEWALQVATENPKYILSRLKVFDLPPAEVKDLLIASINRVNCFDHCTLQKVPGLSEDDNSELLKMLANQAPYICTESIAGFPELNQTSRVDIARMMEKKFPEVLIKEMSKLDIDDKHILRDIFITCFKRFIQSSKQHMDQRNIDNSKNIMNICFQYLSNIADKPYYPDFKKHAEQLGIQLPVIADIFDDIGNMPDDRLRNDLQDWAVYTHVHFSSPAIADMPETVKKQLGTTLNSIYQYRQQSSRFSLSRLLAMAIKPTPGDSDPVDRFGNVCLALHRPHTLVFRPLLCELVKQKIVKTTTQQYVCLLSRDELKDKKRQHNVVNGLQTLLDTTKLLPEEKQRILQALTPDQPGKQAVKIFSRNMQNLADFIPLINEEKTGNKALEELFRVNSGSGLERAFGKLFLLVLGRAENSEADDIKAERFIDQIQSVTKHFRQPNALLIYCCRLYTGIGSQNARVELFNVINQFIDDVMLKGPLYTERLPDNQWVDTISDAYRDEKNRIDASPHLISASKINSQVTRLFLHSEIEIKNVFSHYGVVDRNINIAALLNEHLNNSKLKNKFPYIHQIIKENWSVEQARQNIHDLESKLTQTEKSLLTLLSQESSLKDKEEIVLEMVEDYYLRVKYPDLIVALEDLKLSLSLHSTADHHQDWTLKFTHDVENSLLCGTELYSSCLEITGDTDYNKALMGIVVQGKNRIITLHSADNVIQARCIVRLGIDKIKNQLVLHLERTYANNIAPENTEKAFSEFVREFAQRLGGVPVLIRENSFTYGRFEQYPNEISFDGDKAWVEYVDSGYRGIEKSRHGFTVDSLCALK